MQAQNVVSQQRRSAIWGVGWERCIFLSLKRLLFSTRHREMYREEVRLLTLIRREAKDARVSEIPYRYKELFYPNTNIWKENVLSPSLETVKYHWTSTWPHLAGPKYTFGITFFNAAVFCLNLKEELQENVRVVSSHTCWHCHSSPSHHPHGHTIPSWWWNRSRIHSCWHAIRLHNCGVVNYVGWCCV